MHGDKWKEAPKIPCDSRISTNLTDPVQLGAALDALGYTVESRGDSIVATREGRSITFSKGYGGAYTVSRGVQGLTEITMEYSKVGVKAFAKSRGFAIQSFDDKTSTFTLVNRRAG